MSEVNNSTPNTDDTQAPATAVKTIKTCVEVTKNAEGTWLNLEIGGKKATLSLSNSNHGPMVSDILKEWGDSHFKPKSLSSKALSAIGEFLLSAAVTVVLFVVVSGAVWMCYINSKAMASGFGMALGAGLLGGLGSYFKLTRSLLRKLFSVNLFQ